MKNILTGLILVLLLGFGHVNFALAEQFTDEMIEIDGNCDTRNLEAIKRLATAYLKLLFPNVTSTDDIDVAEFRKYCLNPAIKMRWGVLCQLRFLDEEYENVEMPVLKLKGE